MLTDSQLEVLIEEMDYCLNKREGRSKKRAVLGRNVGPLNLNKFYEVVTSRVYENYYFGVELEDFKEVFEECYVNQDKRYSLLESGYLDPKGIYPYYTYKWIKNK